MPPKKTKTSVSEEDMATVLHRLDTLQGCVDQLEKENRELKERVEELEKKQASTEKKVSETVRMELRSSSYVDTLKKNLNSGPGKVVTVVDVADMQDRKMNIIVRGIKEAESEEAEVRRKQSGHSQCHQEDGA